MKFLAGLLIGIVLATFGWGIVDAERYHDVRPILDAIEANDCSHVFVVGFKSPGDNPTLEEKSLRHYKEGRFMKPEGFTHYSLSTDHDFYRWIQSRVQVWRFVEGQD